MFAKFCVALQEFFFLFSFFFWALINCCVLLTVTPIILRKIQGLPGGNFIDLGQINAIPSVLNSIHSDSWVFTIFCIALEYYIGFFFVCSSIVFSNCCMTQPETGGLTGGIVLDCYSFNFCF